MVTDKPEDRKSARSTPKNGSAEQEGLDEKALLRMKNARKMVDNDAQLLANRIKMLQNEEKKLMKKIEQTRKRADDIMRLKQQNEDRYNEKMLKKHNHEENVDNQRQKNTMLSNQSKNFKH